MAEILIGNIKGPQGIRGTQWFYGTGITGENTAVTVFAESGVENAHAGDFYLSTAENSIGNTYVCITPGDASTAGWVYAGNIRGPRGIQGETGPMPTLINNFLTAEAGLGAADAVTVADLKKEIDTVYESLLDTAEEIKANTDKGKMAGALGVQELFAEVNESLSGTNGWIVNGIVRYCVKSGIAFVINNDYFDVDTSNEIIGYVPAEYAPSISIKFDGWCDAYGSKNVNISIGTDGAIKAQADASYSFGGFMISYPIK